MPGPASLRHNLGSSDSRVPPELFVVLGHEGGGAAESEMKLVGAVYDLATGRVRFLD